VQLAAPAGCEQAAREFYGVVLGLSEVTKPEALRHRGGVWFAMEQGQLHIGVDPEFRPATKAHPALVVTPDQLSILGVRLRAAGYPVEADDAIAGVSRFFTSDPWGNRLEIMALQPRATSRRSIVGASRGATAINRARRAPRGRRV
jgi:catechol 2,3-dioxygenase-like lactoylglutathione lyase family enzyme